MQELIRQSQFPRALLLQREALTRYKLACLQTLEERNQEWSNCELAEGTSTRIYSEYGERERASKATVLIR